MRNYKHIIFLFGAVFLAYSSIHSQEYKFNSFTKLNGLPSNKITSINQDHKGYLWIGTDKGLSRFDGNSFVNYNSFNGLSENSIEKIWVDENNNLFITHSNSSISKLLPNYTFESADRIPRSAILLDSIQSKVR